MKNSDKKMISTYCLLEHICNRAKSEMLKKYVTLSKVVAIAKITIENICKKETYFLLRCRKTIFRISESCININTNVNNVDEEL